MAPSGRCDFVGVDWPLGRGLHLPLLVGIYLALEVVVAWSILVFFKMAACLFTSCWLVIILIARCPLCQGTCSDCDRFSRWGVL